MNGKVKKAALLAGVAVGVLLLMSEAHGGGTIGWAEAMGEFSTEGTAVGAAAVVLGIMAVGAILMFGLTGLITTVVMVCLGGALMAKAEEISSGLFGAGAGGGSVFSTSYAAEAPAKFRPDLPH